MLERTQRRATKYIPNFPFLTNVDYNARLQSLYLLPISYWLEYLDMTFFFKITHGMVETSVVPVIYAAQRATRSSSSNTKYDKFYKIWKAYLIATRYRFLKAAHQVAL